VNTAAALSIHLEGHQYDIVTSPEERHCKTWEEMVDELIARINAPGGLYEMF
jgi:hypothetical protein